MHSGVDGALAALYSGSMQPADLRAMRQAAVRVTRMTEPTPDDLELAKVMAEAVIKLVDELREVRGVKRSSPAATAQSR